MKTTKKQGPYITDAALLEAASRRGQKAIVTRNNFRGSPIKAEVTILTHKTVYQLLQYYVEMVGGERTWVRESSLTFNDQPKEV